MYPKEIMRNTYWAFRGERFSDMNTFIKIVLEYHRDLEKEWDPSEIVFNNKGMTVQYSHWDEIEEDEIEEDFEITSKDNIITAGYLLYCIHNEIVSKLKNDDRIFFEGLVLWEGENFSNMNLPLYFLSLGS